MVQPQHIDTTCDHIWSDKDATTAPALASPNDDIGRSQPQSKPSAIMTTQFVSHITLPRIHLLQQVDGRYIPLVAIFATLPSAYRQSLVGRVGLRSECLFYQSWLLLLRISYCDNVLTWSMNRTVLKVLRFCMQAEASDVFPHANILTAAYYGPSDARSVSHLHPFPSTMP